MVGKINIDTMGNGNEACQTSYTFYDYDEMMWNFMLLILCWNGMQEKLCLFGVDWKLCYT